jgi:hypothetical protein
MEDKSGCTVINSFETDKELGMNYCEKYMRINKKDVRTIIWVKEDSNGHHHFEVSWSPSNSK